MIRDLKSAPNQLTMLRLLFVPLAAISVVDSKFGLALAIFLLAGISDALDGWLARWLNQKTLLGQYLDPIADKLLLSTMFVVLSSAHRIPWKFTILVFSRDIGILLVSALLFALTPLRDFTPSIFGKLNTIAQIATVLLVLVRELSAAPWLGTAKTIGLWCTFALTLISWIHYTILMGQRLRTTGDKSSPAA
jgi:cardiolipin synthase (CMP-forming)